MHVEQRFLCDVVWSTIHELLDNSRDNQDTFTRPIFWNDTPPGGDWCNYCKWRDSTVCRRDAADNRLLNPVRSSADTTEAVTEAAAAAAGRQLAAD